MAAAACYRPGPVGARASAFVVFGVLLPSLGIAQDRPPPQDRPAQDRPPVPPAPGFEEEAPRERTKNQEDAAPKARPRSGYGRTPDKGEQPPPSGPLERARAGAHERMVSLLRQTSGIVELSDLLDEMLAEAAVELAGLPLADVSPLAVRQVALGSNLRASFAPRLRQRVTTLLHAGTRIEVKMCLECEATTAKVEGEELRITRGVSSTARLRALGETLGVETFLDVRFGFDPEADLVELELMLFRARDGRVLWADSYRSDSTTPMLLRTSEAPQSREERIEDLRMLLEGRPFFGYVATTGIMLVPYDGPNGDIFGPTAGFRLYERFGTDRRALFGIDAMGFLDFESLAGAIVSAGGWWVPIEPDLVNPELRIGGKVGAFITGAEVNTGVFQLGAELLLRYRFGLYAYAAYFLPSGYTTGGGTSIGGLGASAGVSFNW